MSSTSALSSLDTLFACAERAEARLLAWFDKNPEPPINELNSASQALWRLTAVRKTLALLSNTDFAPSAEPEPEDEKFELMPPSKSRGAYPEVEEFEAAHVANFNRWLATLPSHLRPKGHLGDDGRWIEDSPSQTPANEDANPATTLSENPSFSKSASSPTPGPTATQPKPDSRNPESKPLSPSPLPKTESSNPNSVAHSPKQSQFSNFKSQIHLHNNPSESSSLLTLQTLQTLPTLPTLHTLHTLPLSHSAFRTPHSALNCSSVFRSIPVCRLIPAHPFRTITSALNKIIGRFTSTEKSNSTNSSNSSNSPPHTIKALLTVFANRLPKLSLSVQAVLSIHGLPGGCAHRIPNVLIWPQLCAPDT